MQVDRDVVLVWVEEIDEGVSSSTWLAVDPATGRIDPWPELRRPERDVLTWPPDVSGLSITTDGAIGELRFDDDGGGPVEIGWDGDAVVASLADGGRELWRTESFCWATGRLRGVVLALCVGQQGGPAQTVGLDEVTGATLWTRPPGHVALASGDTWLVTATEGGTLLALDPVTGATVWSGEVDVGASVVATATGVIVVSFDDVVAFSWPPST